MEFEIIVASLAHISYAEEISDLIRKASTQRGTGIANRTPAYIKMKIESGDAIIALQSETLAGFCYIETWDNKQYVANSGLIVADAFRHRGLAGKIKRKAFDISKKNYPGSKLFGITTSLPVMKINSALGYKPVTFSELTQDATFWEGCKGCRNHDILLRNDHKMCLCTAMMYDNGIPKEENKVQKIARWQKFKSFLQDRAQRLKKFNLEKND